MKSLREALDETETQDLVPDERALKDLSLPDSGAVVQHPDGWYWLGADARQQFGPFPTLQDALADMNAAGDDFYEPGESLQEAEQELGIADWLDADTGEPAEHTRTHIEDH